MKLSREWLNEFTPVSAPDRDFAEAMTLSGSKVEITEVEGAEIENVVVGKVLSLIRHPNSDHMWICQVDIGGAAPIQIVTGAQNVREGDLVPVAKDGSTLPGGVHITAGTLRGEASVGMLCSYKELGMTDHDWPLSIVDGIFILNSDPDLSARDLRPGDDLRAAIGYHDHVVEFEITPNRPDCLSMVGMAVETSAVLDEGTHITLPSIKEEKGPDAHDLVDVQIDDAELCPRYTARVVRNVKIGPSPEWLARRVIAAGSRPINNVVDVTNYVMYLTGQPLHAFDLGKLQKREDGKRHVVVRAARDGELLTTLDEKERSLTPDMCVITDGGETPIALAGVMGGLNSEIDETTTDVLLESATFSAGHISRTSRNLDLMSEASIRYERQVDGAGCADVSNIAAALFEECCSAEVCPGIVDVYPGPVPAPVITMRPARVRALAGADIPDDFMVARLKRLGCKVEPAENGAYTVTAPTNRPDLTREVDLIEEVVRLWGEGDITPTLPAARNHAGGLTVDQQRIRKIGRTLRACGLSETTTYCFADANDLSKLGMSEEGRGIPVKIINPLVADQAEMRRSILPGLLRSVAYNLDHGVDAVALYEIGRVFFGHENKSQPDEPSFVCGVLSGHRDDEWCQKFEDYDFFDAKGVVEQLLSALRVTKVRFKVADPQTYGWLQPGRAAEVYGNKGELMGWVGNIHPKALKAFGVDAPVVAFELSVESLLRLAHRELPYVDVPTLPGVDVDLAIVVDESVTCEQLEQRIKSAGGKLLSDVRLFDVYRDPVRVGLGKKSMAFSLTYRSADHTLTSEEVDRAHKKVVDKVCRATGGEVRG